MRKFALIISWLFWLFAGLCTASSILLRARASHLPIATPSHGIEQSRLLFWGATIMVVAFTTSIYLIRHHYWFLKKRQMGVGFCILTVVFYISAIIVPFMGFAPFFEGDRSILQWFSSASGFALLIIGFPKLSKTAGPSQSSATVETTEDRPAAKWALFAAIACGSVAVLSPTITVHILKSKAAVKNVQQLPPPDFSGLTNPPSIIFSTTLPPSWNITEQSGVTNQGYLVGNRVLLRNTDQKRMIIVSVVGKKTEGGAKQAFFDSWKSIVIEGLKSGYGDDIRDDGFSINQLNGRKFAYLESHTVTTNGILNFLTEGWVEKGFPVTCQSIGKGVIITNDKEIACIVESIKLND